MYKTTLLLATIIVMLSSCMNQTSEKMVVASRQGDCVGVAPMNCYLVKEAGQNDWQFLYNEIDGFEYEPGYEYEIEVVKEKIENPAADQSSIRYILIKVLSKTKKESENLPV